MCQLYFHNCLFLEEEEENQQSLSPLFVSLLTMYKIF